MWIPIAIQPSFAIWSSIFSFILWGSHSKLTELWGSDYVPEGSCPGSSFPRVVVRGGRALKEGPSESNQCWRRFCSPPRTQVSLQHNGFSGMSKPGPQTSLALCAIAPSCMHSHLKHFAMLWCSQRGLHQRPNQRLPDLELVPFKNYFFLWSSASDFFTVIMWKTLQYC